jgi:hypothetical protein
VRAGAAELLQAWARRVPWIAPGAPLNGRKHLPMSGQKDSRGQLQPEPRLQPRVFPRERKIAMPDAVRLGVPVKDGAGAVPVCPSLVVCWRLSLPVAVSALDVKQGVL